MANRPAFPKQPTELYINCVVLSAFRSEFTFLRNVFGLTGIRMHHAESLEEADFLLRVTGSTVLLSDLVFVEGSWQSALRLLGSFYPLVTMLVIADPSDRPFLADLFNSDVCGVIWRPFEFETVRRMIRAVHEASKERQALQEETLARQDSSGERATLTRISDIR